MLVASAESHEVVRVAAHLEGAEQLAKSAPPRGLDRLRSIVRTLLLQELEVYRREGVFPKNRDFPERAMPYFVDAEGTRCAMAHLLELGGAGALVARIAAERNNAFVRELADEPELLAWLDAAGLTVDEAARIQPSYCVTNAEIMVCGEEFSRDYVPPSASGVLELHIISGPVAGKSKARVENVFGDGGPNVVGLEVTVAGYPLGSVLLIPLYNAGSSDAGSDADATAADGGAAAPLIGPDLQLHPGGIVVGSSGATNAGHPLTAMQIADAFRSTNCVASLISLDPWWNETTCTGGSTPEEDAGAPPGASSGRFSEPGASSTSGATASPSADDGGGCSTAGSDASAATLQVLLALVGAIAARRAIRARLSG